LQRIDAVEELARMDGYRDCVLRLHKRLRFSAQIAKTPLRLVTALKIPDWTQRSDRLSNAMTGPGYLFVFATFKPGTKRVDPQDRWRFTLEVDKLCICQFTTAKLATRINNGSTEVFART